MKQSVIYTRVSSERQANEGGGLQSQEQRCRSYAQNCGYKVLRTFSDEGVSGALINRPGIQTMLAFLQEQAGETIVIIDDISRIARDVIAHVTLREAIKAAGGWLESPSFTFGESAADELLETIMAATAQYGRKGNREQVLNRQKARLQLGYWTFPAPPGYTFEKHPVHKKLIVPSAAAKRILALALGGLATGRLQTNREFVLYLQEQGFFEEDHKADMTTLEKRVTRILDDLPLYAGFVEYPQWGVERVPGQHEAIISLATLSRLEERQGRKTKPIGIGRIDSHPQFILRNFVRCAACGRPLTGSLAKGKYPRYFCYYQGGCSRYGHSISAQRTLEPAFEELLRSLTPSSEFMEIAGLVTSKLWKQRVAEWDQVGRNVEGQIERIQTDMSGLVRHLSKASDIVAIEIEKEIELLKGQRVALEAQLACCRESPPDFKQAFERVSTLFRNPYDYWKSGSETQKRTVHRLVFTVPPAFDKEKGFSTYELTLPYRISTTFAGSNDRMVDLTDETLHQKLFPQEWFRTILEWAEWV